MPPASTSKSSIPSLSLPWLCIKSKSKSRQLSTQTTQTYPFLSTSFLRPCHHHLPWTCWRKKKLLEWLSNFPTYTPSQFIVPAASDPSLAQIRSCRPQVKHSGLLLLWGKFKLLAVACKAVEAPPTPPSSPLSTPLLATGLPALPHLTAFALAAFSAWTDLQQFQELVHYSNFSTQNSPQPPVWSTTPLSPSLVSFISLEMTTVCKHTTYYISFSLFPNGSAIKAGGHVCPVQHCPQLVVLVKGWYYESGQWSESKVIPM